MVEKKEAKGKSTESADDTIEVGTKEDKTKKTDESKDVAIPEILTLKELIKQTGEDQKTVTSVVIFKGFKGNYKKQNEPLMTLAEFEEAKTELLSREIKLR